MRNLATIMFLKKNPSKKAHCFRTGVMTFILIFFVNLSFAQTSSKYNVILILVDDMNERCSMLGWPEVITPNLERLKAHGTVFTNAFDQFSLCNPSRTSLLTGWRPDLTNVLDNNTSPRSQIGYAKKFLPEYFHDFGYHTERYGKIMHSQFESECSWDYPSITSRSAPQNLGDGPDGDGNTNPGQWWVTTGNDSLKITGRVCREIDSALRNGTEAPFFFGLGLQTPHTPFTPGINDWNKYGDPGQQDLMQINSSGTTGSLTGNGSQSIALPNTPVNDMSDIPQNEILPGAVLALPDDEWRRSIHAYYGEVTEMDNQLGRVLDAMDDLNLWSNTIIIFTSDHGQHLGEHEGLWFKNDLFKECLHVPLIICAPTAPHGVCDRLVELVDLFPTLTDLCGLINPPDLQGNSLKPLLFNPQLPWKPAVFSEVRRGTSFIGRAVINNEFHYNRWGTNMPELYDRINDPFEYTNLALDSFYADTIAKMKKFIDSTWRIAVPPSNGLTMFFRDQDNDGYGSPTNFILAATMPPGYVANSRDFDDNDSSIHPGAAEICDGKDNNCDGIVDVVASIRPTDSAFMCPASSALLSVVNNKTGDQYKWLKNGSAIYGAVTSSYNAVDSGKYALYEYNSFGCGDTSNFVYVKSLATPTATITPSENLNLCDTGEVILTATAGPTYTYQWLKGTTEITNKGKSQLYFPTSAGNYKVRVTNAFGCVATSKLVAVLNNCEMLQNSPGISFAIKR